MGWVGAGKAVAVGARLVAVSSTGVTTVGDAVRKGVTDVGDGAAGVRISVGVGTGVCVGGAPPEHAEIAHMAKRRPYRLSLSFVTPSTLSRW